MRGGASAERRLVLLALGSQPDAGRELEGLAREVTWARVMEAAGARLLPMLRRGLREKLPEGAVPERVRGELARATIESQLAYQRRHAALREMVAALRGAGIEVVGLKGVVLAHRLYPAPGLRPMSDVDLLVPRERLREAAEILVGLGWASPEELVAPPRDPRADDARAFWKNEAGACELHTALESAGPPILVDMEEAWRRSEAVDLGGIAMRALDPETFLVELCVHLAAHHRFVGALRWLLDVHLFASRYGATWDWSALATRWRSAGHRPWTQLTLGLSKKMLGTPIPDAFFEALPALPGLEAAEALAVEQMWEGKEAHTEGALCRILAPTTLLGKLSALAVEAYPFRRLSEHATAEWGVPRSKADLVTGLTLLRRDLTLKARTYAGYYRDGHLSPRRLKRAIELERGRRRIEELIID